MAKKKTPKSKIKKKRVSSPKIKTAAKTASVKKKRLSGLFTFRRYKKEEGGKVKKSKHPKLIVDERDKEYGFMGLTSSPERGNHKNILLSQNPQKGKTEKSYIRNELRYDDKKHFSKPLPDYKLAKEDKELIEARFKKQKEKKEKNDKKKK